MTETKKTIRVYQEDWVIITKKKIDSDGLYKQNADVIRDLVGKIK